jgi:hypothetical protein
MTLYGFSHLMALNDKNSQQGKNGAEYSFFNGLMKG